MRKILLFIVCLILSIATVFVGCQPKSSDITETTETTKVEKAEPTNEKAEEDEDGIKYTPVGQYPIVDEKITLTAMMPSIGWIPDMETNEVILKVEEVTNIHIEWVETSKEQFAEKLSVMTAGGEIPDIIFSSGAGPLTKAEYEIYGGQGIFIDLTDLIDEYSVNIKHMLAEEESAQLAMKASDGKIYYLPRFQTPSHMETANKFWINKQWLENLDLEVPTTTDELYNVLKAFKEQDANGNGDSDDEIPLTAASRSYENTIATLISAFVPAGGLGAEAKLTNYEFIINGEAKITAVDPEFQKGIQYVKKLYDEGLIDEGAFTQERDSIKPLVDGGDANRIGSMTSHHPGNFSSIADMDNGRFREFEVIAPVSGPNGVQSIPWMADGNIIAESAISTKCENTEAAIRWLDYWMSPEMSFSSVYGIEGYHWTTADEGALDWDGNPAKFQQLKNSNHEENNLFGYMGPGYETELRSSFQIGEGYDYGVMIYIASQLVSPYKVMTYPYKNVSVPQDEAVEFTRMRKEIESYIGEMVVRFILSDSDIETEWDAYIEQLNEIGLQEYTEKLNSYYK